MTKKLLLSSYRFWWTRTIRWGGFMRHLAKYHNRVSWIFLCVLVGANTRSIYLHLVSFIFWWFFDAKYRVPRPSRACQSTNRRWVKSTHCFSKAHVACFFIPPLGILNGYSKLNEWIPLASSIWTTLLDWLSTFSSIPLSSSYPHPLVALKKRIESGRKRWTKSDIFSHCLSPHHHLFFTGWRFTLAEDKNDHDVLSCWCHFKQTARRTRFRKAKRYARGWKKSEIKLISCFLLMVQHSSQSTSILGEDCNTLSTHSASNTHIYIL